MKASRIFLVVSLLIVFSSLSNATVPFETVLKLKNTGVVEPKDFVITTMNEWCRFWDEVHRNIIPPPPCDTTLVDFATEAVIVTALGEKPDQCYDVEITNIEADKDKWTVYVKDIVPGPRCICALAIASPVHAVKVRKPVPFVEFMHYTWTLPCGGPK